MVTSFSEGNTWYTMVQNILYYALHRRKPLGFKVIVRRTNKTLKRMCFYLFCNWKQINVVRMSCWVQSIVPATFVKVWVSVSSASLCFNWSSRKSANICMFQECTCQKTFNILSTFKNRWKYEITGSIINETVSGKEALDWQTLVSSCDSWPELHQRSISSKYQCINCLLNNTTERKSVIVSRNEWQIYVPLIVERIIVNCIT